MPLAAQLFVTLKTGQKVFYKQYQKEAGGRPDEKMNGNGHETETAVSKKSGKCPDKCEGPGDPQKKIDQNGKNA